MLFYGVSARRITEMLRGISTTLPFSTTAWTAFVMPNGYSRKRLLFFWQLYPRDGATMEIGANPSSLTLFYQVQKRFRDAERLFKNAIGVFRWALPGGHPDMALALYNRTFLDQGHRRFAEAARRCLASFVFCLKILRFSYSDANMSRTGQFALYDVQGLSEAVALLKKAVVIFRQALPMGHEFMVGTLCALAAEYEVLGESETARALITPLVDHVRWMADS